MRDYEEMDPDDGSAELEAHIDAVVAEYEAARCAIRDIVPGMDRSVRWAILDRFAKAALAVEIEKDRASYGAINDRIIAEMRAEARA